MEDAPESETDKEEEEELEAENEESVLSMTSFFTEEEQNPSGQFGDEAAFELEANDDDSEHLRDKPEDVDDTQAPGSAYLQGVTGLAGIVAFRLMHKFPYLADLSKSALGPLPQYVEPYSKPGRCVPAEFLDKAAQEMDKEFRQLHNHKKYFVHNERNAVKNFCSAINKMNLQNIPKEAVALFGRLRLMERIRCINRQQRNTRAQKLMEKLAKEAEEKLAKQSAQPEKHTRKGRTTKNRLASTL